MVAPVVTKKTRESHPWNNSVIYVAGSLGLFTCRSGVEISNREKQCEAKSLLVMCGVHVNM